MSANRYTTLASSYLLVTNLVRFVVFAFTFFYYNIFLSLTTSMLRTDGLGDFVSKADGQWAIEISVGRVVTWQTNTKL